MALNTHVVILKRTDTNWSAQVVYVSRSEVVTSDTAYTRFDGCVIKNVYQRSGWSAFLQRIIDLKIIDILRQQNVNEMKGCGGSDGMQYFFEFATLSGYRFFEQCYPEGNLMTFVTYLETEFGF